MGLGGVCLLAGAEKALAPNEFYEGVRRYRLVPDTFAPPLGAALIAAELVLGGLLVTNQATRVAAALASVLFGLFAVALAAGLARSNRAPCHCFGASELETISPVTFVRAVVLSGLALALVVLASGDPGSLSGRDIVAGLLIAAGVILVTRLWSLFPLAWSFLRAPAVLYPTPTRRTSFRHQPLNVPLFPDELK
jgi:hypothetical protein